MLLRISFPSISTWRLLMASLLMAVFLQAFMECFECEERAFQSHDSDGDAEHAEHVFSCDCLQVLQLLAFDGVGKHGCCCLADGASLPGEGCGFDGVIPDLNKQLYLIAAKRVVFFVHE